MAGNIVYHNPSLSGAVIRCEFEMRSSTTMLGCVVHHWVFKSAIDNASVFYFKLEKLILKTGRCLPFFIINLA